MKTITKLDVEKQVSKKIEIVKIRRNGAEYWIDFKVKGKLGIRNTSGRNLKELCSNIQKMSKY